MVLEMETEAGVIARDRIRDALRCRYGHVEFGKMVPMHLVAMHKCAIQSPARRENEGQCPYIRWQSG
jgi:hypothetical protein